MFAGASAQFNWMSLLAAKYTYHRTVYLCNSIAEWLKW